MKKIILRSALCLMHICWIILVILVYWILCICHLIWYFHCENLFPLEKNDFYFREKWSEKNIHVFNGLRHTIYKEYSYYKTPYHTLINKRTTERIKQK